LGQVKNPRTARQQRTGAFLLTLGDNAVRLSTAKAIRANILNSAS